jgi:hypothetical protein
MCERLGIRIIAANSPQAKGRVERNHGTHQDRLVKKLRRQKIQTYAAANAYLEAEYLAEHNKRFARVAAAKEDYHRRRPAIHGEEAINKWRHAGGQRNETRELWKWRSGGKVENQKRVSHFPTAFSWAGAKNKNSRLASAKKRGHFY